jgi:H+/gluconate symporter-like permease
MMTVVGLLGILIGLGLLILFAFRGWSVLLLAPLAALIAALFSREPLLAHWTQNFMVSAAGFLAQFFPLFLLGALFGKLMEDSGSVAAIAGFMTRRLGPQRAVLAVVLAGALVTYGGVSLFVAFFVLAPMAQELFRVAGIPRRLTPAAIVLGTSTFTMSALPGTPSIQNAIPMPFFGTTPFAAPGLGILASLIMLGFGLWWLNREEALAKKNGESFGDGAPMPPDRLATDEKLRELATTAREFDPAEIMHGEVTDVPPPAMLAALPLVMVIVVNLTMSLFILPALDSRFLAEARWGGTSLAAVGGVWAVITALACAIATVLAVSHRRLPALRATIDAGANAAVLPAMSVGGTSRMTRECQVRFCEGLGVQFPQRSPPSLLTTAACGGLRSTPDCRPRRALLHLSYSCAPPCGPAVLVTQDPRRTWCRDIFPLAEGETA